MRVILKCLTPLIVVLLLSVNFLPAAGAANNSTTVPDVNGIVAHIVGEYIHDVQAHEVGDYIASVAQQEADAYIASLPPPLLTLDEPSVAVVSSWPSSLQPCDGAYPPCYVKNRESGGDYNAQNPSSSASGAWQFLDSTWNGYGGYARAVYAPPAVQDAKAAELWAGGAGCSHWSAC